MKHRIQRASLVCLATASLSLFYTTALAEPTPKPFVAHSDGITFDVVEQAPHRQETPLQIFGAFAYKPGDVFSGSDVEMDAGLNGLVQDLRKNHHFGANLGENILVTPGGRGVAPKRVLIMALGNPQTWQSKDMEVIGAIGVREACRLGLKEFSHASDVQDGGVTRESAGVVAEHVFTGMIQALRIQSYIVGKGLSEPCGLHHITYLAGPKYFKETTEALTRVITKMRPPPYGH